MISLNISVSRSGKDKLHVYDDGNANKRLFLGDANNLINKHTKCYGDVSHDDVLAAIETIVVYFATSEICGFFVDVNQMEREATPKKKMTKTEIEEALGYPIDIVEEDK